MSIVELGALGEFIGSIAVLITLIYLTVQIRQNTLSLDENRRLAMAEAAQARTDLGVRLLLAGGEPHYGEVLRVARANVDMDSAQQGSARSYYSAYMRHMENLYYQHRQGFLDEYHSKQLPHLVTLMFYGDGFFDVFWEGVTSNAKNGVGVFSPEFVNYVNSSKEVRDTELEPGARF
jgi:hypothetical protein